MRGIIGELKVGGGVTIIDMEAGLELFGRGTPGPSDLLVTVVEPSLWSIQTALRIADLAAELGVPKVVAVANKTREPADVEWIREALRPVGVEVVAVVPYDPAVSLADRRVRALLDIAPESDAVRAIGGLVDHIEGAIRAEGGEAPVPEARGGPDGAGEATSDDECPWVVDKY